MGRSPLDGFVQIWEHYSINVVLSPFAIPENSADPSVAYARKGEYRITWTIYNLQGFVL